MGMMQDGGAREKNSPAGWNPAAVRCDYCKSTAALIFCTTESAFMCMTCDVTLHVDMSSKHGRLWICEVCEQAPAKFSCKADAAALCVTCDRNIHSANTLASRHERVPISPFYATAESMIKSVSTMTAHLLPINNLSCTKTDTQSTIDRWTSLNPITSKLSTEMGLFTSNLDRFLEFDQYPISTDSVVPVKTTKPIAPTQLIDYSFENRHEIDFTKSNIDSYNNYAISTPSLSVSSSSLDVGVVPDGSPYSNSSLPFTLITSIKANKASQMVGIDREARVLRYREKRKRRKFDKTIRYASRKAYAESRPRIKGRFVKRTEAQSDTNTLIFSSFFSVDDAGFGAVPSF